jgi:lysophospholipase L1-like esterase
MRPGPTFPAPRRAPRRASRRRALLAAGTVAGIAVAAGAATRLHLGGVSLPRLPRPALPSFALPGLAGPEATAQRRPPLTAPLTYVAIGASDALGFGLRNPAQDGWVPLLAGRLPAGTRLVNLGVPGLTLHEALEAVVTPAVGARPGLITIWLVVNDILAGVSLPDYRADLDRLLGALRQGTRAQIAVGNLPDPPGSMGGIEIPAFVRRTIIGQWNGAIAGVAEAHQAILVDLSRRWPIEEHPEYIGPDGLHPTAAGYRSLADVFHTVLQEEGLLS